MQHPLIKGIEERVSEESEDIAEVADPPSTVKEESPDELNKILFDSAPRDDLYQIMENGASEISDSEGLSPERTQIMRPRNSIAGNSHRAVDSKVTHEGGGSPEKKLYHSIRPRTSNDMSTAQNTSGVQFSSRPRNKRYRQPVPPSKP